MKINSEPQIILVNLNRVLIFILASAGMLMDNYQPSDLFCICSLIVWLWLPAFIQIETKILNNISRNILW